MKYKILSIIILFLCIYSPSYSQIIVLDPGHGGSDPGAVGPVYGVKESQVNLEVAYELHFYLIWWIGYENIFYTRNASSSNPSLTDRRKLSNDLNADVFISIHHNGYGDPYVQGTETFYDDTNPEPQKTDSYNFDNLVQDKLLWAFGYNDRGVKTEAWTVLHGNEAAAAYPEASFLTNPAEELLFYEDMYVYRDYWHILDEAYALDWAIDDYLVLTSV